MLDTIQHSFLDGVFLFQPITEHLVPKTRYALVGPSGAGKSTLLNIIAGWLQPTLGSLTYTAITKTSWVFQNPHGIARRSAIDHVALPLLAAGQSWVEAHKTANELMATFGLGNKTQTQFRALSGGEAQRLMLARAMAGKPDLLLIDEPTAQLDAATAQTVIEALRAITTGIVIIATHDSRARAACDFTIELKPL